MKKLSRFPLWIILASATLINMSFLLISPVLNLIREALDVDSSAAGIVLSSLGISVSLSSPLMGALIDKMGIKKPFVLSLILYGLAGFSGIFINSYWMLIFSRILHGIAVSVIIICSIVVILNHHDETKRNRIMGWRVSANNLSGVIWPLVGGFLGGFYWRLPFALYLASLPLGFFALLSISEVNEERISNTIEKVSAWKIFTSNSTLFTIFGLQFITNLIINTVLVFLPPLLEEGGISNPFHIGMFITAMMLSVGVTSLFFARIKSKLSCERIIHIALAILAIGFTIISQVVSIWISGVSVVLVGIGQGMIIPALIIWVGEIVPTSYHGRITSYLVTFGFIGTFLVPIIFRPVALFLELNIIFLIAGGICAVQLLFLLGRRK